MKRLELKIGFVYEGKPHQITGKAPQRQIIRFQEEGAYSGCIDWDNLVYVCWKKGQKQDKEYIMTANRFAQWA